MMASFEIIVTLAFLSHVHSYPLADCGPQVCAVFEETQKTFDNMCSLLAEIEETGVGKLEDESFGVEVYNPWNTFSLHRLAF